MKFFYWDIGSGIFLALALLSFGGKTQCEEADNTMHNKSVDETLTADSQSNDPKALDIATKVRKKIVSDKSLSTYGHNVKIITNGEKVVILKGPVRSEQEKNKIASIAGQVDGVKDVVNQLEIVTK